MRLGRLLLLVAIVAVVGIGAIYLIQNMDQGVPEADLQATQAALQTVTVVVLKQPVARGQTITDGMVEIRNLPIETVNADSTYSEIADVIGEIARIDLSAGTFLNQSMLLSNLAESEGSDHAWLIDAGKVAFPVPISRFSSVAYGLTRGDNVDVIVTMAFVDLDTQFQSITPNYTAGVVTPGSNIFVEGSFNYTESFNNIVAGTVGPQGRAELDSLLDQPFYYVPSETQRARVVSQRIMQGLIVLQVGNFPVYNALGQEVVVATSTPVGQAADEEAAPPPPPTAPPPDIVTLIMTPQEAITLNYLLYTGAEVTLALRAANDGSREDTNAVTLQYLMDVYRIPLPVRLPYGTQPRIDVLEPPVLENDPPRPEGIQQ
ncbi:MAG TPA: Flp pilus assembly protein CpaB [Chloroflexi bacterium]|nr:Flp pilus assembly protein CpaB [Chloroflexota bacterium]